MGKHLVVVPRWGATPESVWYSWLDKEMSKGLVRTFSKVSVLDMPDVYEPRPEVWVDFLKGVLGDDPQELSQTVLLGHSVACRAILKVLEGLEGPKVSGVLCVAGWWDVDQPWESLQPWVELPLDCARVKSSSERFVILLSDNDPFTADFNENKRLWEDRLGAEVIISFGVGHFNGLREMEVLQALTRYFM